MEPANAHPLGWASGPPVGEPLPPPPANRRSRRVRGAVAAADRNVAAVLNGPYFRIISMATTSQIASDADAITRALSNHSVSTCRRSTSTEHVGR